MTKSIADRMAEAAEMDLCLPYSLVQDAWDRALTVDVQHTPTRYEGHLIAALDAYEADPLNYWTPERIARARGTEVEEDREDDGQFYLDAAHRDGDHASCTHD